jgi:hypothetical protein
MLWREIDLRWIFLLETWEISDNAFKRDDDGDVNWSKFSFKFDSIEFRCDLKTQNSLNVWYFSVETQKTLHVSRNAVLSTIHSDEYLNNLTKTARMIRDLILTESNRIWDLIFVMIIIWMICKSFSIRISRANLCFASQNWFSSKASRTIASFKWIMKIAWNVYAQK